MQKQEYLVGGLTLMTNPLSAIMASFFSIFPQLQQLKKSSKMTL